MRARQRGSLNDGSPLQECLAENDRDWRACQKGVSTLACKGVVPQKEPIQSLFSERCTFMRRDSSLEALLPEGVAEEVAKECRPRAVMDLHFAKARF